MLRSFKTEIDPTPEQIVKINKTIGVCRYIYNFYIERNKEVYEAEGKFVNARDFIKWLNNDFLPNNPDFMWIKEVSTVAVKRSVQNADQAFGRFFKKQSGFPKFKKKHGSDVKMYFYRNNKTDCICERHRVKLPMLGWIRLKEKGYLPTTDSGLVIKSGTISKKAGRYYISALVEMPEAEKPEPMTDGIGVHLGVRELATVSNGDSYENINKSEQIRKLNKQLKRAQRSLSRMYEHIKRGGKSDKKNIEKQRLKIQRIHQRIANIRTDHTNKVISEIVRAKPSYITVGDLSVTNMSRNRIYSKAVTGQQFYSFREKLTAKCAENGIELRIAEQTYPYARRCSKCGAVSSDLSTRESIFKCKCGYSESKALNASLNLKTAVVYTVA